MEPGVTVPPTKTRDAPHLQQSKSWILQSSAVSTLVLAWQVAAEEICIRILQSGRGTDPFRDLLLLPGSTNEYPTEAVHCQRLVGFRLLDSRDDGLR